jgi:hypothetical protein
MDLFAVMQSVIFFYSFAMLNAALLCLKLVSPCVLLAQVQDVDFFDDSPFPRYDVITMGMILHDWGLENKKLLMKQVRSRDADF